MFRGPAFLFPTVHRVETETQTKPDQEYHATTNYCVMRRGVLRFVFRGQHGICGARRNHVGLEILTQRARCARYSGRTCGHGGRIRPPVGAKISTATRSPDLSPCVSAPISSISGIWLSIVLQCSCSCSCVEHLLLTKCPVVTRFNITTNNQRTAKLIKSPYPSPGFRPGIR